MSWEVKHGDCLEVLRDMPENSIDSCVTDPPYGLGFMGKDWDHDVPGVHFWQEIIRVLKPGAHLLAFAGSRTYHRMACAIEDAGFEIRDQIMWLYGSGFPKSLDVSKAIDKAPEAEREILSRTLYRDQSSSGGIMNAVDKPRFLTDSKPATDSAKQWQGWGTALKPAHEPIVVARKPLIGTVAANVQQWGTGAINIDGCRIPVDLSVDASQMRTMERGKRDVADGWGMSTVAGDKPQVVRPEGRWPANVIHDGSEEVVAAFPDADGQQGDLSGHSRDRLSLGIYGDMKAARDFPARNDSGSAARFFYCPKVDSNERHIGGENRHPTVKPIELMQYLCRLVTPPMGTVLDPFTGSGSTGIAAVRDGFSFVGIELSRDYVNIAQRRIEQDAPLFNVARENDHDGVNAAG